MHIGLTTQQTDAILNDLSIFDLGSSKFGLCNYMKQENNYGRRI